MKLRSKNSVLISLAMVISLLILSPITTRGDHSTVNGPTITDVTIEIANKTGILSGLFEATGTAPAGTDHVNITFAYSNSTTREEIGFWFEPVDAIFLGNGMALIPTGEGENNWTTWKFTLKLNIPMGGDLTDSLSMIAGMMGFDLPDLGNLTDLLDMEGLDEITNLTGVENVEDLLDMEFLMEFIMDSEVLVVAHAVDGTGAVTTGEEDFKFQAVEAAFTFMQEEGIIEAPPTSDNDDDINDNDLGEDKSKDDGNKIVLVTIISIIGVLLILIAVIAVVVIMIVRKRPDDPGFHLKN